MANTFLNIIVGLKDGATGALRRLRAEIGGVVSALFSAKGLLGIIGSYVTVRGILNLVRAWGDQEDAVFKLNAALRATGRFTAEGSQRIQTMAREMQHLTTVSDDALVAATATLAQFSRALSTDQLAQLQKAIVGIAQVTDKDIPAVALAVGKGIIGIGRGLKMLGIDLKGAATEQDRFNIIMGKSAAFYDVAVASSTSLTAQLTQAHNAWTDLQEVLGQIIVFIAGLNGEHNTLRDRIEAIETSVKKNEGAWVKWGRVVVAIVVTVAKTLYDLFKIFINGAKLFADTRSVFIAFGKVLNDLVGFAVDAGTRFWKALITGDVSLVTELDARWKTFVEASSRGLAEALLPAARHLDNVKRGVTDIGAEWKKVVGLIGAEPLPASAFAITGGPGGTAGTDGGEPGPDVAAARAKALKERVAELGAEFDRLTPLLQAGLIMLDEYTARLTMAAGSMNALWVSGQLTEDETLSLTEKFGKAREALGELGDAFSDARAETGGEGGGFWAQVAAQLTDATKAARTFSQVIADIITQFAQDFGRAIESAFQAVVEGSLSAGEAFKRGMLQAIAAVARGLGQLEIAESVKEFAKGIGAFPAGSQHFASAAKHLAAAALFFAVAGTAAGGAGGGGGGGGSARRSESAAEAVASRDQATIIIQGGFINTGDPNQLDQLAQAIEQVSNRRVTIKAGNEA